MPLLIREGLFELYQSLQARPIFSGCGQIVSFIGDGGTRARFVGVYRVLKQTTSVKDVCPKIARIQNGQRPRNMRIHSNASRHTQTWRGASSLIGGPVVLAWHQHLKNKRVIEILPKGRTLQPFSDYLDFTLTFGQLKDLFATQIVHRDWHASLSAVAGIYLVLAETTGHQYVGSAYGLDGIWGRWAHYAGSGHGGNLLLKALLESDGAYPGAFRYSVLQVLPKTTTPAEVIRWEAQYKRKLGSRATGLNSN